MHFIVYFFKRLAQRNKNFSSHTKPWYAVELGIKAEKLTNGLNDSRNELLDADFIIPIHLACKRRGVDTALVDDVYRFLLNGEIPDCLNGSVLDEYFEIDANMGELSTVLRKVKDGRVDDMSKTERANCIEFFNKIIGACNNALDELNKKNFRNNEKNKLIL